MKSLACGQNLQANQKESSIEASPSTYVPRIQTPVSTPYVVCRRRVCGWFSPLLREVFLRVLRFSPLLKIQHFQIQIRPGIRWPKNHYCWCGTSSAIDVVGWKIDRNVYYYSFIIRYLTLFYYLNEPKLGGETAFPVADNLTFAENEVRPIFTVLSLWIPFPHKAFTNYVTLKWHSYSAVELVLIYADGKLAKFHHRALFAEIFLNGNFFQFTTIGN